MIYGGDFILTIIVNGGSYTKKKGINHTLPPCNAEFRYLTPEYWVSIWRDVVQVLVQILDKGRFGVAGLPASFKFSIDVIMRHVNLLFQIYPLSCHFMQ